jgi:hypothetical protein
MQAKFEFLIGQLMATNTRDITLRYVDQKRVPVKPRQSPRGSNIFRGV